MSDAAGRLQRLFEAAPDGIVRMDAHAVILDSNAAFRRLVGRAAEELHGLTVADLSLPDEYAREQQQVRDLPDNGPLTLHKHFVRRDGLRIPVAVTLVRDTAADGIEWWAYVRDLTQQDQAAAELRANEERYRTLADFLPLGVFETDLTGRLSFANRALYALFGYDPGTDLLGHAVFEFIHPDDRGQALIAMHEVLDGATREPGLYRVRHRDGSWRDAEIRSAAVRRGGTTVGLRGYMRDISVTRRQEEERRQAAEELQRLNGELRALDTLKNNLLSTVSHELRTPLVAVRGYAELIAGGYSGPVTPRQREQLAAVLRNLDRLVGLIDNLLTFSRLQGADDPLALETVDLASLAREVVALLQPKARTARIALSLHGDAQTALLAGDPRRLQQVLINLVDNALKFTPAEGSVSVTVHPPGDAQQELSVTDSGIGIPAEEQEQIFTRFYQVESGPTRRQGGVGIGLAVVREIIERHGGSVRVDSRPGQGSTFTLALPRGVAPAATSAPADDLLDERTRILLNAVPDLVFLIDAADRVRYVNPTAAHFLHRAADELIGQQRADLFPPAIAQHQQQALARVFTTHRQVRTDSEVRLPDGSAWQETTLIPLMTADGTVSAVLGIGRDITELKRAEQALRRNEEQYRELIEQNRDLAYRLAPTGVIEYVSPQVTALLGYRPERLTGRALLDYVHPQSRDAVLTDFARVMAGGEEQENEYCVRAADGSARWFSNRGRVRRDSGGKIIGYLGILRDLTRRRVLEQALRRQQEQLEMTVRARTADLHRVNRELEAFTVAMAHDLRTPLRALGGYARALREDQAAALDETGRDHLRRLDRAAQRLNALVSDLVELARLARAELRREPCDLSALAGSLVVELRRAQPQRDVAVTIAPGLQATADPALLRLALRHLLDNAWKFTVGTSAPSIQVTAETEAGETWYTVTDNGIGFDPARQQELFLPFRRLHADDQYPGTGIGLAVVQRIVNRHGGRLRAHNHAAGGAAFAFTLGPEPADG